KCYSLLPHNTADALAHLIAALRVLGAVQTDEKIDALAVAERDDLFQQIPVLVIETSCRTAPDRSRFRLAGGFPRLDTMRWPGQVGRKVGRFGQVGTGDFQRTLGIAARSRVAH